MGVAPTKIIFVVFLSFEVALVSSPNIIIVTKKSEQTSVKKIVIFTINRDLAIKNSETRVVI